MDESEKKKEFAKTKKRNELVSLYVMYVVVVGGALILMGIFVASMWNGVRYDDDQLTDPGIAVRDLKNATWTFDRADLNDKVREATWFSIIGIGVFGIGLAGVGFLEPKKHLHQAYCKDWTDVTYCPDCGYKIKKDAK